MSNPFPAISTAPLTKSPIPPKASLTTPLKVPRILPTNVSTKQTGTFTTLSIASLTKFLIIFKS